MSSQSMIFGTINGISKQDYDELSKELRECFENVAWKDNTLIIKSEKKHDRFKGIATKIADCITEGNFGSLLYVGNNRVICIFFGPKKFIGKQYKEPESPDWWGEKKIRAKSKDLSDKLLTFTCY